MKAAVAVLLLAVTAAAAEAPQPSLHEKVDISKLDFANLVCSLVSDLPGGMDISYDSAKDVLRVKVSGPKQSYDGRVRESISARNALATKNANRALVCIRKFVSPKVQVEGLPLPNP